MSVVTVTLNPCIDKVCTVDQMLPEHKLTARDVGEFPGGGGINVARVVHRLGGSVCALWSKGGPTGELLSRLLDAEAVSHCPVPTDGNVRENIIITDASTEQQYRLGMPGPALKDDQVPLWKQKLRESCSSGARYAVFSGSLPEESTLDGYEKLLRAIPQNVRLVVDTKGEALRRALEIGVFLIKPNLRELQQLTGLEGAEREAVERAARDLVTQRGVQVVVVSLGPDGAMAVTADRAQRFVAPDVETVSKVGAGDSMLGGVVTGLLEGSSLDDAIRLGVAAGTAAVMSAGTELCSRDDTRRLYSQINETGLNNK